MVKAISVLALAAAASAPASALSVEDLRALCELPVNAVGGVARRVLELVPTDVAARWSTWGTPAAQHEPEDFFPPPMPLEIEGEDTVRAYPTYPHAPLLVAAANCDSVVLRWKSFDDERWPVDSFVLQRFPDHDALPQWEIISSSNASELVDEHIRPGFHYTYRVQVISNDVASAYSYHWTRIKSLNAAEWGEAGARAGWFGPMHSMAHRHSDALRTIGLICACFLTVYGLMRANVKSVQGTRSRSYRLKRIKKSTSEGVAAAAAAASASGSKPQSLRRSSSSSTSSPASALMDSARSNSVDEMVAAAEHGRRASIMTTTTTRESTAEDPSTAAVAEPPFRRQAQSMSSARVNEKAEYCQDCRKRFGIFRRRHLCDICHSVTLCRKCGFQAPIETYNGRRSSTTSASSSAQRKLKIRTICRNCCDDVYRYSTAPDVRPSVPHHALSA